MKKAFIKASEEFCTFEKHINAPYIRKEFELSFVPDSAEISICGLGFYVLYINGVDITKGILAPYISNSDQVCYYDTYDIKEHLRCGKNVIGVMLGNGMKNAFGGDVWDFDKAKNRSAPMLCAEICIKNAENELAFSTDESFKVHPSPITFDDLRMGEYYDANLEIDGWNLPEFDDSAWENAILADAPEGEFMYSTAEPIKKRSEIRPVRIFKNNNGYIYDFGVNSSGLCRLKIEEVPNQKITLRHAEVLDENNELDRSGITFSQDTARAFSENNQIDKYTANGKGIEEYMPHFTFHGFRYVEVIGITDEQATPELLTFCEFASDIKELGDFNCSDETLNTLFQMVKRSDISNFFYFPMDCPHREKNGWTGDASLSAERMVLLYDVEKSFRQWLGCIRKAQDISGRIPSIVPTYGWGYEECSGPAWDSALFNLVYVLYKYRGCLDVVRENKDAMAKYLEYIMNRRNEDGTVSVGLGDWLPVGRACTDYKTPLKVSDSIYVMDMAKKASEMLKSIGEDAVFAENIYIDMRKTIREKLIDSESMAVLGDSQTGQAMALYYGVFEPCEEEKAFSRLMEYIAENDNNFDCGCLGMHVLFSVLSRFGKSELAYKMITKKDYPSYAHLIEKGETTMVEQFMPDGESCGSHNHHFMGDIGRWFVNHIAGLNIIDSRNVLFKPSFIEGIDYARASYTLPLGMVSVAWERCGDEINLDISSCEDIKCCIELPTGYILDGNKVKYNQSNKGAIMKKQTSFKPGKVWLDTNGNRIQAHGGSVIYVDGTYYFYGENKEKTDGKNGIWHWGVRCYSSNDLYNWTDLGNIIPPDTEDKTSPIHPGSSMDRPHIIYNEKTKKFVCWVKIMEKDGQQTETVLTADKITGPYTIVRKGLKPFGMSAGDFDLVVAPDGKAYNYFERPHSETICADLTDDYTDVAGYYSTHFPHPHPPYVREGTAHFTYKNRQYLITSGTTGYLPNPSEVAVADTYHGPFKVLGNPHRNDESNTSFHSQISSVFKVQGKKNLYIACADRWLPEKMDLCYEEYAQLYDLAFSEDRDEERLRELQEKYSKDNEANTSIADYVWLPLKFEEPSVDNPDGMVYIDWYDEWKIEDWD